MMPIRKEEFVPGEYYHVYNRGVNKDILFHEEKDYTFFLKKTKTNTEKFPVSILAYCVMPNHYHFLVTPRARSNDETGSENIISKFFHNLQVSYGMYFNKNYKHSGYVFQGRFQAKRIDNDSYLQYLSCYIHYNPKEAILVNDPRQWKYSSIKTFLDNTPNPLVDPKQFPYEGSYRDLFQSYILFKKEQDRAIEDYTLE